MDGWKCVADSVSTVHHENMNSVCAKVPYNPSSVHPTLDLTLNHESLSLGGAKGQKTMS